MFAKYVRTVRSVILSKEPKRNQNKGTTQDKDSNRKVVPMVEISAQAKIDRAYALVITLSLPSR